MDAKRQEILDQIKEILTDIFEIDEDKIVPEAKLYDDLDIDSIDAVDMLIDLKKRTDVDISAEQFNEVRTIQDVVDTFATLIEEDAKKTGS